MAISRRRGGYTPLTPWRVGLFFFGAGIWVGGLVSENRSVTGAAIGVLVLAAVLGLVERARGRE